MEHNMIDLFNDIDKGAEMSKDRQYRYALWRIWDKEKYMVMFIGLNPSTANESKDDPTIRRVIKFAQNWGYGGVYMMNLYPFVTAYPHELQTGNMDMNNKWLIRIAMKCHRVVFAWGNFLEAVYPGASISKALDGWALEINQNGSPKHPLYVKGDIKPVKYKS